MLKITLANKISKKRNTVVTLMLILSFVFLVIDLFALLPKSKAVNFQYCDVLFLPASFFFLLLIAGRFIKINGPGITALFIISFVRYVLLPSIILYTNEISAFSRTPEYYSSAILVMVIEMAVIFAICAFYHPKAAPHESLQVNYSSLTKPILLIMGVVIVLNYRSLIGNVNILEGFTFEDAETVPGMVSILWQSICVFLYATTIAKWKSKGGGIWLPLLLSVAYLFIVFTGQISLSRWYTVITLLSMICWLLKLYPDRKKQIFLTVFVPAVVLVFLASVTKNLGSSLETKEEWAGILDSTLWDSYFAGPTGVSNAIGLKESGRADFFSIGYDVLNNFPALGNLIDRTKASVRQYNLFIGRGDQILPLVGQSFTWFGYILSPLLSGLAIFGMKKTDAKYSAENGHFAFLYAFLAVWFAMMPILNATIFLSWMYARIIPAFLLLRVLTRTEKKQNGKAGTAV